MRGGLAALAVLATLTTGACSPGTPAARQSPATRPSAIVTGALPATPTPVPGKAPARRLAVATTTLRLARGADRPLPTTVWYPKQPGHYPLVLFSHGLGASPASYTQLLSSWAAAGFVVAAPAYPHTAAGVKSFDVLDVINQPADASYVITQVLTRLRTRIRPGKIAAAGHSAGGITTLGLFTSSRDTRLTAGIVLAGEQVLPAAFSGPAAPLLFVHGKQDRTVPYANGQAAYTATPWPKAFLSLTKGGHTPTGAQLTTVIAVTTDFLRWSMYGDPTAKSRLPADATEGHLATLTDHL